MLNKKGFTLVELMIVVAIIGILAAIAIPNFVSMQYKTKRAEVPSNLKGIKTSELAYESNFDVFVAATAYPASPTKTTQDWVKASSGGFASMGWSPDGDVRGSYSVTTAAFNFTATGLSDVDGDSVNATYVATKSENPNAPITGPDIY
jgi:type IV pilus assembly protein PilA